VFLVNAHLVLVTKYRHPLFTTALKGGALRAKSAAGAQPFPCLTR
jgi:REP element-mobilizing transposase RayT